MNVGIAALEQAILEAGLRLEKFENNAANAGKMPVIALAECLARAAKSRLENNVICPEDMMRVLLPAQMIPHDSIVSKRTGEAVFTLKHKLTMYGIPPEGSKIPAPPTIVEGFFVVGERGTINQVRPETPMHWRVRADELVDVLMRSWEIGDHQ